MSGAGSARRWQAPSTRLGRRRRVGAPRPTPRRTRRACRFAASRARWWVSHGARRSAGRHVGAGARCGRRGPAGAAARSSGRMSSAGLGVGVALGGRLGRRGRRGLGVHRRRHARLVLAAAAVPENATDPPSGIFRLLAATVEYDHAAVSAVGPPQSPVRVGRRCVDAGVVGGHPVDPADERGLPLHGVSSNRARNRDARPARRRRRRRSAGAPRRGRGSPRRPSHPRRRCMLPPSAGGRSEPAVRRTPPRSRQDRGGEATHRAGQSQRRPPRRPAPAAAWAVARRNWSRSASPMPSGLSGLVAALS